MTSLAFGKDWRSQAACAGDTSTFHTHYPGPAKDVCGRCSVRPECLYDAVVTKAPNGVWGGLTREERKLLPVLPADKAAAISVLRGVLDAAEEEEQPAAEAPVDAPPAAADTPPTPEPDANEPASLGVRPRSTGGNYTPEERAAYERRCVELLRAGASYGEITAELGITAPVIVRVRRQAGLPHSGRTGGHPARKKAEVLAENTERFGDGHARWTGPASGRMPTLYAEQSRFNARHVAFEQHHGRAPVGYVRSNCGQQTCITGAHLTDDLLRSPHPPSGRTSPAVTTTLPAASLPTKDLLEWADNHPDADVRDAAARARAGLAGLRTRYDADHELTAIEMEKAKLEAQLATLAAREAELTPPKKKRKAGSYVRDYDTRTVRAWAVEQGIDCPPKGQIPKRVLDAWRAANAQTSGGTS